MQIKQALKLALNHLVESDTAQLDAQLLLSHALGKSREKLLAWPESELSDEQEKHFLALLTDRSKGQPVAYLLGRKAFWDFELLVSPVVLIPRPETELLVETMLEQLNGKNLSIADLGTGSGAIALALAKERTDWQVLAIDTNEEALKLAKQNAQRLGLTNVQFKRGNWCEALKGQTLDAIVSNPPYIDREDKHLQQGDLRFEPGSALIAGEHGMADLRLIAQQARDVLCEGGLLVLEHGYQQGEKLRQMLDLAGYNGIETRKDLAGLERVTMARR